MLTKILQRGFLLLFAITLNPGNAFSQNIPDSLKEKLDQATAAERPEILILIAENIVYDYPSEALKYATEALGISDSLNNEIPYIEALLVSGDSYLYSKNYELSEKFYLRALDLSEKINNPDLIARSNYFLAYLLDDMNEVEKAKNYYDKAINGYDSLKRFDLVADLSSYYADLLTKQAENYQAKKYYERALKIYDSTNNKNDVAETLNSMGLLFYNTGNYEKAVDYYNQSMELMQQLGSKSGVAQAINNLGILYHNRGNPNEALKYYQESLKLEEENKDMLGVAGAYNNIGIIYAEKGLNDKAINYYEKALATYEELDDKSGVATALNNLGESFMDLGKTDLATVMLRRSLEIEKEIEDKYGVALAYITLSEIYFDAGNLNLSRQYNDSSQILSDEINNPEVSLAVYENFYKLSEAEGNHKKALEYHVRMTTLKDSLFNTNLHKQLSEVKAQYELEQKEREIALLNSENQISQLDLKNKQDIVYRQRLFLLIVLITFTVIIVVLFILYRQTKDKKAAYKSLDEKNHELLESQKALVEAKEKAEESDRLKSIFLANMSHELRTPLNGILGFTEVLRTELLDANFREMADIIYTSGNRLLDTLNSIIDLSIIESNRMEIEHKEFSLEEFIGETFTLFKASAMKKNLEISADLPHEDLLVTTDRKILSNLLNNLIDNAIKYTNSGNITIKAEIESQSKTDWLIIRVKDTGIGIEADRLKHIFDKFRQGSEGHDRQFEGAGLGLSICKKYVELLDGKITAKSQLKKGSEFSVEIPVKINKMAVESFSSAGEVKNAPSIFNGQVPNVLIVENNEINLKHMVYVLKEWCNIDTAKNGREAVYKAGQVIFDVILMDINLGTRPNGMEVAKSIREINGYNNTPIIAVTANAMKGHREEFLANGCTHYLSKPFSVEKLKQLIVEALSADYSCRSNA